MQVHPDIAALRGNRAPQRQAQTGIDAARKAWLKEPGAQEMHDEIKAFGEGAALEDCPQLHRAFTQAGEAERLMILLCSHYCRALAANPIGHPPFRNGFDGTSTSILLAHSGRAQLMLQAREPGEKTTAGHMFSDAVRFDAVMAGEARGRIVRDVARAGDSARFTEEAMEFRGGNRLALDLGSECVVIDSVQRRFVVLRLLQTAGDPAPCREYDAKTGRMIHQCAGDIRTSRQEAIIALLGRMNRTDAAPEFARVAIGAGDMSLRWQAVREALALDTATGFRTLCQISRRSHDPLCGNAGALRAQLLDTYPQLARLESDECRV